MTTLHEISQLITRHNTDETFTDDAEQVIESIESIIARDTAVHAAERSVLQAVYDWVSRQPPERHDHEHMQGIIDAQHALLDAKNLRNRSRRVSRI